MQNPLLRDLDGLMCQILQLAARVEEVICKAIRALRDQRPDLADEVIREDEAIDRFEVRIEEDCLRILALHQPVAIDLRRVATVLKINNDLERMADLAVNIAERAICLAHETSKPPIPASLESMTALTLQMVRGSLDAFVNSDAQAARLVCLQDDRVDSYNREIIEEIKQLMQRHPQSVDVGLHLFSACRHLERIADHATNIAEDVVYLKEGDIIRHHSLVRQIASPAMNPA